MKSHEGHPDQRVGLWHEAFYALLAERGAGGFDKDAEHLLSMRPRRADMLLLQRKDEASAPGTSGTQDAKTLRGLWPRLSKATLLEFKSPVRGFRRGELCRLVSYGAQYCEQNWQALGHGSAVTLVMVMPRHNRALADELAFLDLQLEPLDPGYARIRGGLYTTYVVATNEVAQADDDDFLRIFSQLEVQGREARRWLEQFFLRKSMPELQDSEEYDELLDKLLERLTPEQRLRGLGPEERLRGLGPDDVLKRYRPEEVLKRFKPEERLRGLSPEEAILALPAEVLRGFSEDYIRTLPEHIQAAIRQRLGKQ